MPKTKNKYIGKELEWLEQQWQSLQDYVDANPIDRMSDRTITLNEGLKSEKETVTATIEQQITSIRNTQKDMIEIASALQELRERNPTEEIKIKGDDEMPWIMKKQLGAT